MTTRFKHWLSWRWRPQPMGDLCTSYKITFESEHGQKVLQHLLDEVYCRTCPSLDPLALATHNACRSVVQDILEKIDIAEAHARMKHDPEDGEIL